MLIMMSSKRPCGIITAARYVQTFAKTFTFNRNLLCSAENYPLVILNGQTVCRTCMFMVAKKKKKKLPYIMEGVGIGFVTANSHRQ